MAGPSNLKVKRLDELDALPAGTHSDAYLYAVHNNHDYKVTIDDIAVDLEDAVYDSLSTDEGAAMVGYKYPASGSVTRPVRDRLAETVSVRDYGAVPDGVTDSSAAVALAVARAVSIGAELYWPAGTFLVSSNIPSFHSVRHTGPGVLRRGSTNFVIEPRNDSIHNRLYVSPTGNDSNDGLTDTFAFGTIQRALDVFSERGGKGRWTIQLAAGVYTGRVDVSSLALMEFPLTIQGPAVGHPNVPTAIISAPVASDTIAIVRGMTWVIFRDVLFRNATSGTAVECGGTVDLHNVHITNCLNATTATHCAYIGAFGGIWTGLGKGVAAGYGYKSYYNSTHSIVGTSSATGTVIQGYQFGMLLSEGCQGHLDFAVVQDCATGVLVTRGAGGSNTKQMTIRRCDIGLDARNQWYNNSIAFGTGADANTVNVRSSGSAPEYDYRADDFSSKTMRRQDAAFDILHTGTTTEDLVYTWSGVRSWMVSEGGDAIEMNVVLSGAASAGTIKLQWYLWDGLTEDWMGGVTLPVGTTNAQLRALLIWSASNMLRFSVQGVHNTGALSGSYGTAVQDMKNKTGAIRLKVQLSDPADTANIRWIETHTTLGG